MPNLAVHRTELALLARPREAFAALSVLSRPSLLADKALMNSVSATSRTNDNGGPSVQSGHAVI